MRDDLPSGTVTFLFTDVEGSTRVLHHLGSERYADALAEHRRVLREAFTAHGGVEVDTQGDAFFVAFPTAPGALAAAARVVDGLAAGPIRVRVGVHTGTAHLAAEGYVGADVHRAARIAAAGHGGQVLVSSATAALVEVPLRDVGEHRLKDLSAPERIYQLGAGDFPPLKSLHQTNLPVPATPFLGRERELSELGALLARDDVRLLTLTGPGGTGKTRLALQAAAAAADAFPAGVWWTPLAALRDAALVLETAAQAVGAKEGLAQHIADKRLLLVFDNFEHVIDAAPKLGGLLAACPNLRLLVTSREPLRLSGEWEYGVDPLHEAEATELFEARAQAVRRDFRANGDVRAICARLDNLPLAIELAAARVKVLSPEALLARLERRLPVLAGGTRDAPERQRTLRATIEWSHELLEAGEQRLFARLAVFRGGWTLDAAEAICGADLDSLASLVDKSLVRQTSDRFWMLETIREYAAERLDASRDGEDIARRHAEHFLALAEAAAQNVRRTGADAPEVAWFDDERDNLRAALDAALRLGDAPLELGLAVACSYDWLYRERVLEGQRRLEAALARAVNAPPELRAWGIVGIATFAGRRGDGEAAVRDARAALELASAWDDELLRAQGFHALGVGEWARGRLDEAARAFDEAANAARNAGDDWFLATAVNSRGVVALDAHDSERARQLFEEAAAIGRRLDSYTRIASPLIDHALLELRDGRTRRAAQILATTARLIRDNGDTIGFAWCTFVGLAAVSANRGAAAEAARLLGAAAAREDAGAAWTAYTSAVAQRGAATTAALTALGRAAFDEAFAEGRALALDDALDLSIRDASVASGRP